MLILLSPNASCKFGELRLLEGWLKVLLGGLISSHAYLATTCHNDVEKEGSFVLAGPREKRYASDRSMSSNLVSSVAILLVVAGFGAMLNVV